MISEVTLIVFYLFYLLINYIADGVKGPKEEMREKITLIKKILDEVSALAEICGGMLVQKSFYRK